MEHVTIESPSEPVQSAPHERLPVVALVGRPNVGKSTLFNRFSHRRKAVVDNTPGVTRDRNFAQVKWDNTPFLLVDTGGIDLRENEGIVGQVQAQTRLAIDEADLVIFYLMARKGSILKMHKPWISSDGAKSPFSLW